jgi:hypothetical protein
MKIGVIIPTYQEQDNIKKIKESFSKLKNINFFFCFIDGSYSNDTSKEIKKNFKKNFKIIRQKKLKIGSFKVSRRCEASLMGFKWIIKNRKIDIITDMDADLSSDPKDILKAIKIYKNQKSDLIIGSKYLSKSRVIKRKFIRILCSKIYTGVCRLLISNKISDYSAGFRFYSPSSLKQLVLKKPRYKSPTQHLENLLFYYEKKLKISEFPARYTDTDENSKSIPLAHILIFVFQLSNILVKYYFRKLK